MNQKLPKKLLVGLIKDDLKHTKLLSGFNQLGLSNDLYELGISRVLFYLVGLNTEDRRLDKITDDYCERCMRVEEFAYNDLESFEWLAGEIYNWLLRESKSYKKRLLKNK